MSGRSPRASEAAQELAPFHVVWEITLACNLRCSHCGSRAGPPRPDELTTEECLDLVDQLASLGAREVTLIGGEAYLRRDWLIIVAAIAEKGIYCSLQTGGRALTPAKIAAAAAAGLKAAGVSIDGPAELHDRLRGVRGSFGQAVAALKTCRENGLGGLVNTQVNAASAPVLGQVLDLIAEAGAQEWRLQLTTATGHAADRPELLLQPFQMIELMEEVEALRVRGARLGISVYAGNNLGYYGPEETDLRSVRGRLEHYGGCDAGRTGLGIEADGAVKGCPSLPTASYVAANVRDRPLQDIWSSAPKLAEAREDSVATDRLWGYCRVCYYADVCRGGCTWTAHVLAGRPGNNPYCHHRALVLAAHGLRERVELRERAPGDPFDHGVFDILVEGPDGGTAGQDLFERWAPETHGRSRDLLRCDGCRRLFRSDEALCPFCGRDPARPSAVQALTALLQPLAQLEADMRAVAAGPVGAGDGAPV